MAKKSELIKANIALKKMDLALATKDIDGLDWLVFSLKFSLEICLGVLEFRANRKQIKFLIPSIIIATLLG